MNTLFDWWHGSNLQISIVVFLMLCALGTGLVLLLVRANKPNQIEQEYDDKQECAHWDSMKGTL